MDAVKLLLVILLAAMLPLHGQTDGAASESPVPYIPREDSPFFVLQEDEGRVAREREKERAAMYPLNKGSEDSAGRMFARFFGEMFASVKIGRRTPSAQSTLKVEPSDFSLDDRRELTVTFSVKNNTGRVMKFDFPTAQRIEIVVKDPMGKIIERWSDDRAFEERAGVVMINPDERIEYIERIPTREMEPGSQYIIEASLANSPEFTKSVTVTPKGKPRDREKREEGAPERPKRNEADTPGANPPPVEPGDVEPLNDPVGA
jgi:hypothetical protein